jgi:DNA-binding IclR family transcriptional regulator
MRVVGSKYQQIDERLLRPGFPIQGNVVKSARRTIELFEFFAEYQQPANIYDVAHALDYPASSTGALLKSLAIMGYLEYDRETRRYFPTLRIALLGGWIQDQYFHDNNALTLMQTLADKTKATVVIGMQKGVFVQYLLVIDARESVRAYTRTGSLRSICRSATGRMLLTIKSDRENTGIVTRSNAMETDPSSRVKLTELLADLEACRKRGYATTSGTVTPGRGVIAMLMPRFPNHVPLAIGIGASTADLDRCKDEWIQIMREQLALYGMSEPRKT